MILAITRSRRPNEKGDGLHPRSERLKVASQIEIGIGREEDEVDSLAERFSYHTVRCCAVDFMTDLLESRVAEVPSQWEERARLGDSVRRRPLSWLTGMLQSRSFLSWRLRQPLYPFKSWAHVGNARLMAMAVASVTPLMQASMLV